MIEHISAYVKNINALYQTGLTTEHSFRPDLKILLEACTGCKVINEQSHIDCGAPDLTLLSKQLPIAYIEAKDLEDGDLDGRRKNKEQFVRYKASHDAIIFTDYLDFHLYEHGEWQQSVRLAEIQGNKIRLSDADRFVALMEHLQSAKPQRITSASRLAQIMAGKARMLRDIIEQALIQDGDNPTELRSYMEDFRTTLLHDITPKVFADIYAQTIAYGMFAARLHDDTPDDFYRQEAANLIPKTNPFLRKVFQQIAGYDLDERIAWIVDDLVSAFAATDMEKIMQGFGKSTQQTDPMLHFYEDFLFQYDPAAKKQCGVYYTPQPVVEFIVRAVDDILRTEFGLPLGLADTSKVEIEREIEQDLKHRKEKKLLHRVQVLDPATGTGTFLAETVRQIKRDLGGQLGAWKSYVPEHLLPRLHGFELMMAPYTIAHLKLDLEVGIPAQDRFRVYLTNSLEEYNKDAHTLFGNYLAQEANAASDIKKDAPVMIVMGNPPYSGISQNNGEWITNLMADYKKEPGGVLPLKERKIWLNDDYCKFIRLGQYYVDRNKEGVLAYICNNGFLDNPTFRGMRWSLLNSFDKIYIINLHGNTLKKETCPDGNKDENVFDIKVGTSINIFIKSGTKKKGELAEVLYIDKYGIRESKYAELNKNSLQSIDFQSIEYKEPYYFFSQQNTEGESVYKEGFSIDELMPVNVTGIVSARDGLVISPNKDDLLSRIQLFADLKFSDEDIRKMFFGKKKEGKYLAGDSRGWKLSEARKKIQRNNHETIIRKFHYRPLDNQYIYYTPDMVDWGREKYMYHFLKGNNLGIVCKKGFPKDNPPVFCSDSLSDFRYWSCSGMQGGDYVFPLYLYPEEGPIETERRANIDETIANKIAEILHFAYIPDSQLKVDLAEGCEGTLYPEDIFDYIYGVLHSPHYRAKYKEFLKVDFPRIPYPKNADEFEHYRACGNALRELHLMHNVPASPVRFDEEGSGIVEQVKWMGNLDDESAGSVWINNTQYFANVPKVAWEAFIGGYQPAQKWLKDRKGRKLSYDDVEHYSKIISVLLETDRIMKQIDAQLYPELVDELQHKVQDLEHQLKQQNGGIVNFGTVNIIDNSKNIKLK